MPVFLVLFLVMLHYLDRQYQQLEWENIRGWGQILMENLRINLAATFCIGLQHQNNGGLEHLLEVHHLISIGLKMFYDQISLLTQHQSEHGVVVFGMTKL